MSASRLSSRRDSFHSDGKSSDIGKLFDCRFNRRREPRGVFKLTAQLVHKMWKRFLKWFILAVIARSDITPRCERVIIFAHIVDLSDGTETRHRIGRTIVLEL